DRAAWNRHLPHRVGHPQVVHPCVPTPLEALHHGDPVYVPLDEVAAQAIRRPQRPLQVHRAPDGVFCEQRPPLGGLHHVNREATLQHPFDRETRAVDGDALASLDPLVRSADREGQPRFPFSATVRKSFRVSRFPRRLGDGAYGAHDSGKHSRLSNTNNVSEPRARRSTGVQRGAAARGCGGTPGKAGTAPSPSHTGACTQYSRSTRPSASSRAPNAPPPSHTSDSIPASRSMWSPSSNVASFSATNGRSACSRANRNGAFNAAAASASRPIDTITPLARRTAAPPCACGSGSEIAATTRATPAARIAAVQGSVLPRCAHGSRFTTSVAPRARSPAARRATTSACGPPYSAW